MHIQRQADSFAYRMAALNFDYDQMDADYYYTRDFTNRLDKEFQKWWRGQEDHQRGWVPLNSWPHIERFLKDNYPAAYRGLDMGMEDAQPLLDKEEVRPRKRFYPTGPKAYEQYGYDPKEIASGMLYLHDDAHGARGSFAGWDSERIWEIAKKRHDMQVAFEEKQQKSKAPKKVAAQEFSRYAAAWVREQMDNIRYATPRRFTVDWQPIGHDYIPTDVLAHYMMRKEEGFGDEKSPLYELRGKPPLSQQIRDQGYEKPVEICTDGKSGLVVDGHHRIDVARQNGWTHVPTVVYWRTPSRDSGGGAMSENRIEPWLKGWLTDMRNGRQTASRKGLSDNTIRCAALPVRDLIHYTRPHNVPDIMANGFHAGRGEGGYGVYFTPAGTDYPDLNYGEHVPIHAQFQPVNTLMMTGDKDDPGYQQYVEATYKNYQRPDIPLSEQGYDSIEYHDPWGATQFIVFDPTKIKTIGQIGPDSPYYHPPRNIHSHNTIQYDAPTMGININDKHQDFTGQILRGEKTIETRDTHSLKPYVGKRIGLVSTGIGPATLVGYANVGEPIFYNTPEEFDADWHRHRVSPDSPYYITPRGKYGYPLTEVEAEPNPRILDTRGIRSRSLASKSLSSNTIHCATYYHVSPHELPEGTVLRPHGGSSIWDGSGQPGGIGDYVWLDADKEASDFRLDQYLQQHGTAFQYEVDTDHDPQDFNGEYAVPSARIIRRIAKRDNTIRCAEDQSYWGHHRPPGPDYGTPLHDLVHDANGEELLPSDIYEHPEYYDGYSDKRNWEIARKVRGNPEAMVTMYRSLPQGHTEFNTGDWVSLVPEVARGENLDPEDPSKDLPVIAYDVPAKHLWQNGDSFDEWGYWGPPVQGRVVDAPEPHY